VARRVSRHSGAHNLKSSCISGVNLSFPFRASAAGRALLAGFLRAAVDARVCTVDSLELEWAGDREHSPRTLLGETGGSRGAGQTSPDFAFTANGGEGRLLVENKLVEHSFYPCSARTGSGSAVRPGHPDPTRCDDASALLSDPGRCHQQTLGRRHWHWLHDAVDPDQFARLSRYPAATAGYQLFRQQALAEALARSGRYRFVVSVLALDTRNSRLAGSLSSSGLTDCATGGASSPARRSAARRPSPSSPTRMDGLGARRSRRLRARLGRLERLDRAPVRPLDCGASLTRVPSPCRCAAATAKSMASTARP